jgi:hypothetical protein
LSSGTKEQSENVDKLLIKWSVHNSFVAVFCDTTASNTEVKRGMYIIRIVI